MRRVMILLALLLPSLIIVRCVSFEEIDRGLHTDAAKGMQTDAELHGCRSCKKFRIAIESCPQFGYDCRTDAAITSNVLSASDQCQCQEARCSGSLAKLAVAGTIVTKVRCNRSRWVAGDTIATAAVCAQPCNLGVCRASNPSSNKFLPLQVLPATEQTTTKCATGQCANGMVAMNADGSLLKQLDWLEGVDRVECTGDGVWAYGEQRYEHVMCTADSGCANTCNETPFATPDLAAGVLKPVSRKTGCAYTCPPGQALYREDATSGPVSIEYAECQGGGHYAVDEQSTLPTRIGCFECDLADGELQATTAVKPKLTNCVVACPDGYIIEYSFSVIPNSEVQVNRLYRHIFATVLNGEYYDTESGAGVLQIDPDFACIAK